MCRRSGSGWRARSRRSGRQPKPGWRTTISTRPSGPSPGPAGRPSLGMSSTIPPWLPASACWISPPAAGSPPLPARWRAPQRVEAAEIDPIACAAIALNAAANGVAVEPLGDVVGAACRWDVVMCGDVCYEAAMTGHIMPWLRAMAGSAEVWIADPGRNYLPKSGLIGVRPLPDRHLAGAGGPDQPRRRALPLERDDRRRNRRRSENHAIKQTLRAGWLSESDVILL